MTISAYENLISTAERRKIINKEKQAQLRISDLFGVIPSITGKIELVYEGEQEGPYKVAQILIGKAIKNYFGKMFPSPDNLKKTESENPYLPIIKWFQSGNKLDLLNDLSNEEYKKKLNQIPCLNEVVKKYNAKDNSDAKLLLMEFVLFGLSEHSLLSRFRLENGVQFKDMLSTMFTMPPEDFPDEDESSLFQ